MSEVESRRLPELADMTAEALRAERLRLADLMADMAEHGVTPWPALQCRIFEVLLRSAGVAA